MKQEELIKLYNVGILTKELIELLDDLLTNIEDSNNHEIVEDYLNYLLPCAKRFAEKMLPILENERN